MITSREFIVFVMVTLIIYFEISMTVDQSIMYGLVAVSFMFHSSISNALYNANITAELKTGISKEIKAK